MAAIGAGMAWKNLHMPAYKRLADKFTISAVCDRDIGKAQEAAKDVGLPGERVFTDYEAMFAKLNGEIEAVDIMTPIGLNYEMVKDVLARGKDVIAEKPFAGTPKGAADLIKVCQKSKVKILIAENFRYTEENRLIKKLIDDREIGNVAYFIDNNVTDFPSAMLGSGYSAVDWRQHPDFEGGIFLDSGVHHVARHHFLFGAAQRVHAYGRHAEVDFCPFSCINALISYDVQVVGHYAFFCIARETQSPPVGFRIFGTHGEIFLESADCGYVNMSLKSGEHRAIPYKPGEGYYNELCNFYDAVRNNAEIISTPEKTHEDMKLIFEILKSAKQHAQPE
ncbi:MAG: Gfo/Idh/MocA family oxidoreductase [Firmicutes bacterium]|nr:Gfo/Idh/MocA family oxidoreductase [Bacillota bacterium]